MSQALDICILKAFEEENFDMVCLDSMQSPLEEELVDIETRKITESIPYKLFTEGLD